MTDMTMCNSSTCKAKRDCKRNPECIGCYSVYISHQSWTYHHPESGYGCPSFIDTRGEAND